MAVAVPSGGGIIRDDSSEKRVRKTVAFSGAAGNGAIGTVNLFTVTGAVIVTRAVVRCTEDLVAAGAATFEVGVAGETALFGAQIADARNIDSGEFFANGASSATSASASASETAIDSDIIATIGASNITDGTLVFDYWFIPVSDDGAMVAA